MVYLLTIGLIIGSRAYREKKRARKNEIWLKYRGAIETGTVYYQWSMIIYCLFIFSFIIELFTASKLEVNLFFYICFLFLQIVRDLIIRQSNHFWSPRMIVLPNVVFIRRGIHKYIKYPYDVIVLLEMTVLPLIFGLYMTAILFPFFQSLLFIVKDPITKKPA